MWCDKPVVSLWGRRRCGKCMACLTAYKDLWYERLFREFSTSKRVHFVTLTFKPVLKGRYEHIQKWIKRCRKAGLIFKYFCVAEPHERNDPVTGKVRLHYHLLIYTDQLFVSDKLRHYWRGGISHARLCQSGDLSYTVKYIEKGHERPKSSNGIGKLYYENVETHPLVEAALVAFPNAKIKGVRDRISYWIDGEYYEDQFFMGPKKWETDEYYEARKRGRGGSFPRYMRFSPQGNLIE